MIYFLNFGSFLINCTKDLPRGSDKSPPYSYCLQISPNKLFFLSSTSETAIFLHNSYQFLFLQVLSVSIFLGLNSFPNSNLFQSYCFLFPRIFLFEIAK